MWPFIFGTLWSIRMVKNVLFWLYLWQLKEYHIGRFIDHFRTTKGRNIFINWLFAAKLALLAGFVLIPAFFLSAALVFYFLEAAKTGFDFIRGAARRPVFTSKMRLLGFCGLGFISAAPILLYVLFGGSLWNFALWLIVLDIFIPAIISAIVLIFQPLAVMGRGKIIKKAIGKRTTLSNLIVIGITGSYGKTSTKEFLALILSEKFKVCKTQKHQNSEAGVAQCVLNDLKPEHEILIAEMGAYGRGGIKLLCDIVKPKIGIITGVNEQHLALFGSMENLLSAEGGGELLGSLPKDGTVIANWDNEHIKAEFKNPGRKIIKYSIATKEDIWAEDIKGERERVTFRVFSKDGTALRSLGEGGDSADFKVNVLGAHYVPNILGAVACAKELGMTMAEISAACAKITPEFAGMTLKKGINGANIISATYSANPDGVISHLEYLKVFQGKKIIIMPCLIELGRASKEVHRRIGQKIGEVCDLAIVVTKERYNDIKAGATEKGTKAENILFSENSKDIFEKVKDFSGPDDVILLEGRLPKSLLELF